MLNTEQEIIASLESINDDIWSIIRLLHEGDIEADEAKSLLISVSGYLNTELLIPLQKRQEESPAVELSDKHLE